MASLFSLGAPLTGGAAVARKLWTYGWLRRSHECSASEVSEGCATRLQGWGQQLGWPCSQYQERGAPQAGAACTGASFWVEIGAELPGSDPFSGLF